ncbi:MAG TPA: SGNH/GDSL hydrolase family protein, partial [Bradyrhizobium sp.]|nr:SGNH/GDSL hydrolase family protein [Bradyrhizobium sp.]
MLAALVLLTPASVAPAAAQAAQAAQQMPPSNSARSDEAKAPAPPAAAASGAGNVATADQANPAQPKSLAGKAIDKVKEVATTAANIFNRVPCLPPKGDVNPVGSLPRVASKLAAGEPVMIIAFGSSSTSGWGSTSPEFTYPNRLAEQLHRKYPGADITVVNRGRGGEDAPEMMTRLQVAVL